MISTASKHSQRLELHDAYLANLTSNILGDFDPKYETDLFSLHIQTRSYIDTSEVFELCDDEDYGIFKVKVNFGVRWSRNSEVEEPEMDICAIIEGLFVAEYLVKEQVEQSILDEFAFIHVITDVWPYWRELLTSQCSRMHLTGVKLPHRPKG
ncbi:hypothetical protein RAM80_06370 [Pseudomonas sp. App30]|uniref:hypothetical protein n=1 Tax=Pseudomonas sp. App30 TaxID=3068990 RepID=UPI003A7FDBBF